MTGENEIGRFDPGGPASAESLWGLPFDVDDAALVIVPVPWEVTVSYGTGTAEAPSAILVASTQVDLENPFLSGRVETGHCDARYTGRAEAAEQPDP